MIQVEEKINMKLIDKIKPEVLRALDRHCKPLYPTSHRMIITSLQDLYNYRELTIDQVSQLKTFLPKEFEPVTSLDWCYGDNILQKKYQL
jgi:hypothetical protein|tara:strand:- start:203 stop:472 length:270 start_codon:yes stop_codon:yes gene_type:complete